MNELEFEEKQNNVFDKIRKYSKGKYSLKIGFIGDAYFSAPGGYGLYPRWSSLVPWGIGAKVGFYGKGGNQLSGESMNHLPRDEPFGDLEILYKDEKDLPMIKSIATDLENDFISISIVKTK